MPVVAQQVTFLDQTGAKSVKARISPTVNVKKILPNIITKMQLPTTAPDGMPMSYSLDHKEGGKRLHEDQTLPDAGVRGIAPTTSGPPATRSTSSRASATPNDGPSRRCRWA